MQDKKPVDFSILAGYASVIIVSILILIKTYAYYASGSMSILSSLVDSMMDSIVSVIALMSIYYARRPADHDHRFGHGKMEAVSALFQAAIITGGGVFLVFESSNHLLQPSPIKAHGLGATILAISIILSIVLVFIQRISLKYSDSLAIEADSVHYGSDILINAGALIIIVGSLYGLPLWIDAFFAFGVALIMAYTAYGIAIKSLKILLDQEVSEDMRAAIIQIIEAHEGVCGWHDLRTRKSGAMFVVSFDIEADGDLSLFTAHDIAKDLESDILKLYPKSEIFIHIDPRGYTQDSRHRVKGVHYE